MPTQLNIWFNRSYATSYWLMKMLRSNEDNTPVTIFASHVDATSPVLQGADHAFIEPSDLSEDDYLLWALEFCSTHKIDVLIPTQHAPIIASNVHKFELVGTRVLVNTVENITLFEDKEAAYVDLAKNGFPVPPYAVARSASEFVEKLAELKATLPEGKQVIIKPISGVGAAGFRIIDDAPYTVNDLLTKPSAKVSAQKIVDALQTAEDNNELVPALMLMPFLESPEISVDCLSTFDGKVIAALPRTKDSGRLTQFSDRFPEAAQWARKLVETYGLSYLTNTQFRWYDGALVVLETNTRMSGGLFASSMLDINMVWLAIKVLLEEDVQPQNPQLNRAYTHVSLFVGLDTQVTA